MHQESSTDPVETVTVRLSQLEITISVRPLTGATGSLSVASSPLPLDVSARAAPASVSSEAASWDRIDGDWHSETLIQTALAARSAAALSSLPLRHLNYLHCRLRGSDRTWTAAARLGRAFRAGVIARLHLDGEILGTDCASPSVPYRNSYYLVLRGPDNSPGFWTCSYSIYSSRVLVEERGRGLVFEASSVSHAFASHAECTAYLDGAQATWPQQAQ